jgi:hypothetical protein
MKGKEISKSKNLHKVFTMHKLKRKRGVTKCQDEWIATLRGWKSCGS